MLQVIQVAVSLRLRRHWTWPTESNLVFKGRINKTPCILIQLTCHPLSLSMHLHDNPRMCSEHTCVSHRWNPGPGSECTHVSQRWNSGTGCERTSVSQIVFWNQFWMYLCHRDGILDQAFNIVTRWNSRTGSERTHCHTEGIPYQTVNALVSRRWNSGTGSEHMHVSQRWKSGTAS